MSRQQAAYSALLPEITGGGIVDEAALLRKPGPVTGAVPCVLPRIPFQRAAHVGTALCGGCEQTCCSFQGVDGQLRMEDASGRGKYIRILALFPLDEVAQEHGGHHGRRHAPFLESGGDV